MNTHDIHEIPDAGQRGNCDKSPFIDTITADAKD